MAITTHIVQLVMLENVLKNSQVRKFDGLLVCMKAFCLLFYKPMRNLYLFILPGIWPNCNIYDEGPRLEERNRKLNRVY